MTITSYSRNSSAVWDSGYKDSVRTPNYRKLRSEGKLLPINSFRQWALRGSTPVMNTPSTQGSFATSYKSYVAEINCHPYETFVGASGDWCREITLDNGKVPSIPGVTQVTFKGYPSASRLMTEANNKLVKKLNSRDIDLGVALGEARETAAFVQSAMLRSYRAFHAARKRDLSGLLQALELTKHKSPKRQRFRDIPDAAAGVWLEYSYAIRPLVSDVFGAVSALEKRHSRPEMVHVRARRSIEIDHRMATSGSNPGQFERTWALKGSMRASSEVSFEISNPFTYTLSQLGLTNPLAVAWELVPFSFVVDWFTPIGDWFQGLVPPQGISSVKGSSTVAGEFHGDGLLKGNFPVPPNKRDGAFEWPGSWWGKFKVRNVLSSIPRYHLVGADFSLSKEQVASGISLLWAVGAGRKAEQDALNNVRRTMDPKRERLLPESYWRV